MASRSLGERARRLFRRHRRKRGERARLTGILEQVRRLGFAPATVIDVGAAYGDFALQCLDVFPDARYVLIEALAEYSEALEQRVRDRPGTEYVAAAAAASDGEITINVHGDLVGSSLYLEQEDSTVNGVPRTVASVTLDTLREGHALRPPFLLKIDVQGAELDVLACASQLLKHTGYVLLEVSFFEFFAGGPQFHDIIAFMKAQGFVAYDLSGLQYRPLDGALSQADVSFVREDGPFRKDHYYATREQRDEQDRSLERRRGRGDPGR
jgi:FkbM family methyltransferase